ncbi:hypothetical protein DPMN_083358 [Dreissena polymorpha]|uniref:Uncharacterized protein n=1 Tax=Dreissena polymorpha TaxID=45954 RepID=A0A9D3Y969_DREPO|nr:hypothetical protein DPMN_083358 [Dreissena polymorpha]
MGKRPRTVAQMAALRNTWTVADEVVDEFAKFTCVMYENAITDSVNKLRFLKIKEVCGDNPKVSKNVDLSVLPPCKQCLLQHIRRVNYQGGIWKKVTHTRSRYTTCNGRTWMDQKH